MFPNPPEPGLLFRGEGLSPRHPVKCPGYPLFCGEESFLFPCSMLHHGDDIDQRLVIPDLVCPLEILYREPHRGCCQTLRHEGIDYGDYIEQITYLLFLKMAMRRTDLPAGCSWDTLKDKSGTDLTDH